MRRWARDPPPRPVRVLLDVEDDGLGRQRDEMARNRVAEARGAAGDDGPGVLNLHELPLRTV